MSKLSVVGGLAVLAVILLSGCGGGQRDIETATQFMNALNQGDVDTARALSCPEEAEDLIQGLATVGADEREEWEFQNVNCQAYSGEVLCSYQIAQEVEDATQETNDFEVVFEMEGGKVCGFAESLQEDTAP